MRGSLSILVKPVSGACNLDCSYCFYRDEAAQRLEKRLPPMTEETLTNLISRAFQGSENEVFFVFQGGEPTLAGLDFFNRAVSLQKQFSRGKRYHNSLQTNGMNLDDKWCAFLKQEDFLVGLSLDGEQTAHDACRKDFDGLGSHARVLASAALLRRHEVPFNVLAVLSRHNTATPEQTYSFLRPFGYVQFIPCVAPIGSGYEAELPENAVLGDFLIKTWELYKEDLLSGHFVSVRMFDNWLQMLMGFRPESCSMDSMCALSVTVEADGSVYPCDFYCLDEWKLGNVNENSFDELFSSPAAQKFISSSAPVDPKCTKCRYYALCRGGCRRLREDPARAELGANRYCEAYRRFFDAKYKDMAQLAGMISARRGLKG
ncbi:MAG: anaerobic sulfatase maturase [Clostridiales bacterium]|nr:anaerobic sulfatase maturase [Clostridiales bacterium]